MSLILSQLRSSGNCSALYFNFGIKSLVKFFMYTLLKPFFNDSTLDFTSMGTEIAIAALTRSLILLVLPK